ncbi:MAG: TetR/AcrR family transcriptional regulator [Blastococcus sp.]
MHGPEADGLRTPRQRELIRVATHLFAQRGYHAVGINEISGELGLTGPAFYRHYPSKEALLIAVLDDAISGHLEEVRDLVSSIFDPHQTLDAIIAHHVEFVFEQTENIMTWRTEFRMIPENDRHRLRYLQRLYTEEWVRTLRQLRPELGVEQVRAMCHAAIALLQSPTEFHNRLPRAEVTPVLVAMATQALMGSVPTIAVPAPARATR